MITRSLRHASARPSLRSSARDTFDNSRSSPRGESSKEPVQYDLSEAEATTMFDQLMEGFSRCRKRSSKVAKKRGRKKGTRNKCSPEVTKKLGDATLLFIESKFKKAISILHEIVRIAPNLPKPYYLLGCIYAETGKIEKAINFLMLAAHVSPKDAYQWKKLIGFAREKEDAALARYCILKAIRADPEDTRLKYICADIYCKSKTIIKPHRYMSR